MQFRNHNNTIRSGFTLIELTIVIGIIALLAALTLGLSSSIMRNSEIRRTEDVLKLLTMALKEWELERGRPMTFRGYIPIANGIYDVDIGFDNGEDIGPPSFSEQGVSNGDMSDAMSARMQSVVDLVSRSEGATELFSKISTSHFDKDSKLPLDAWGTPIGIVFPGRNYWESYPSADPSDDQTFVPHFDHSGDQSIRDQAEDGLGSCMNLVPYFVSAGPDRKWGYRFQSNNQNSTSENDDWVDSHDNVYSYKPFLVESAE